MVTITQQPNNKSAYFYPDTDLSGCTEWVAFGNIHNYECVDDERGHVDFDDYVKINTDAFKTDLYELENSTQTGVINYVRMHSTLKADFVANADVELYLMCSPESVCTDVYLSDKRTLTNAWSKQEFTWSENPKDSSTWEWGDIDTTSIGIKGKSSPSGNPIAYETLRPNGVGDDSDNLPIGDTPNYKCVDEATIDSGTYIQCPSSTNYRNDFYQMENTVEASGMTIENVTIYSWSKKASGNSYGRMGVKISGNEHWLGAAYALQTSWSLNSYEVATNPDTGNPWTSAEIDSMQAGIELFGTTSKCTQLYIVVKYAVAGAAYLKVAQCYLEVNYVPPEVEIDLNPVIETSYDHASNVKTINFWNGDREVYALNRSGKSLMLSGAFYDKHDGADSPFTRIDELREMGKDGSDIVLEGFTLDCFNGTYKINSLGWRLRSTNLEVYEWVLQLESTEL